MSQICLQVTNQIMYKFSIFYEYYFISLLAVSTSTVLEQMFYNFVSRGYFELFSFAIFEK